MFVIAQVHHTLHDAHRYDHEHVSVHSIPCTKTVAVNGTAMCIVSLVLQLIKDPALLYFGTLPAVHHEFSAPSLELQLKTHLVSFQTVYREGSYQKQRFIEFTRICKDSHPCYCEMHYAHKVGREGAN